MVQISLSIKKPLTVLFLVGWKNCIKLVVQLNALRQLEEWGGSGEDGGLRLVLLVLDVGCGESGRLMLRLMLRLRLMLGLRLDVQFGGLMLRLKTEWGESGVCG